MEMSSGCLRPAPAQSEETLSARPHPVRGPHGGWRKQEIETLQKRIDEASQTGESLRSVFDRTADELGRKPNSIRNFYYAQVRAQSESAGRALPFETFSADEVEQLLEHVLTARAQGMSVRACVRELAGGDQTLMLRYQNKYRSTIKTRPELVRRIMDRLAQQGIAFVSPYSEESPMQQTSFSALQTRAQQTGDPRLTQLFSSLEYLMDLAAGRESAPDESSAQDHESASEQEAPKAQSDAIRRADRLSARLDLMRIALDDEQTRRKKLCEETEGMVTLIKEYIALPQDGRAAQTDAFCHLAAQRLSAVECAMMEPEE